MPLYLIASAEGTVFNFNLPVRIVEIAAATAAMIPVTVEIDLSSLNRYLPSLDESSCNFFTGISIDAGKGRARHTHQNRCLVMIILVVVTQSQSLVLFIVYRYD